MFLWVRSVLREMRKDFFLHFDSNRIWHADREAQFNCINIMSCVCVHFLRSNFPLSVPIKYALHLNSFKEEEKSWTSSHAISNLHITAPRRAELRQPFEIILRKKSMWEWLTFSPYTRKHTQMMCMRRHVFVRDTVDTKCTARWRYTCSIDVFFSLKIELVFEVNVTKGDYFHFYQKYLAAI